jgi:hypothetical protein
VTLGKRVLDLGAQATLPGVVNSRNYEAERCRAEARLKSSLSSQGTMAYSFLNSSSFKDSLIRWNKGDSESK